MEGRARREVEPKEFQSPQPLQVNPCLTSTVFSLNATCKCCFLCFLSIDIPLPISFVSISSAFPPAFHVFHPACILSSFPVGSPAQLPSLLCAPTPPLLSPPPPPFYFLSGFKKYLPFWVLCSVEISFSVCSRKNIIRYNGGDLRGQNLTYIITYIYSRTCIYNVGEEERKIVLTVSSAAETPL